MIPLGIKNKRKIGVKMLHRTSMFNRHVSFGSSNHNTDLGKLNCLYSIDGKLLSTAFLNCISNIIIYVGLRVKNKVSPVICLRAETLGLQALWYRLLYRLGRMSIIYKLVLLSDITKSLRENIFILNYS